jgi:assimilatory nitrate reductase catalytic subunit
MTRTGRSPKLGAHLPEPFVEVHPQDASNAGLIDGGLARVSTEHGACLVTVVVSDAQRPGSLFVPIHWSSETASSACVGDLVSARTDPHSGQPEAKATPTAIAPVAHAHRGFVRTQRAVALPQGTWWTRIAVADGMEYRLATNDGLLLWHDFAYRLLAPDARLAEHLDGSRGIYRAAAIVDGERESSLCIGPAEGSLPCDMFEGFLPGDGPNGADLRLLQMRSQAADFGEREQIVCACFGIGLNAIREAVACGEATNLGEIGQVLRAGTNCGSCLPELRRIIATEKDHRS